MKTRFKQIVFTLPGQARLHETETSTLTDMMDAQSGVLIETEFSIASAGTELACLAGTESWASLPFVPGYGSVGRVVRRGSATTVHEGQRVLTFGKHAGLAKAETVIVPVPETLDPAEATFARMASVAITSLRASGAELGDCVAVIGLGLVGNLAAQLFALSGCEVIGIDLSARRREQAAACGIPHTLAPGADLRERVAAITGGRMCGTVVEATGLSVVATDTAPLLCGKQGEIVLLGSPRAAHPANITPFLSQLHLCRPMATVKGALEWRYPVREDTDGFTKHSIERNVRQILRLLERGLLKVKPLLTHRASPADCQAVYDGLANQKDIYTGVVFDWSKI
ncbi:theronine dehydrogenase-like Zn-dependent dehydrogenase [Opitutaceae bacterium TAV1]|nr:theronine dehydrogenase-like Zn-dependent dehydrogenase [Opitutaceae bacterium TAV1]